MVTLPDNVILAVHVYAPLTVIWAIAHGDCGLSHSIWQWFEPYTVTLPDNDLSRTQLHPDWFEPYTVTTVIWVPVTTRLIWAVHGYAPWQWFESYTVTHPDCDLRVDFSNRVRRCGEECFCLCSLCLYFICSCRRSRRRVNRRTTLSMHPSLFP